MEEEQLLVRVVPVTYDKIRHPLSVAFWPGAEEMCPSTVKAAAAGNRCLPSFKGAANLQSPPQRPLRDAKSRIAQDRLIFQLSQ